MRVSCYRSDQAYEIYSVKRAPQQNLSLLVAPKQGVIIVFFKLCNSLLEKHNISLDSEFKYYSSTIHSISFNYGMKLTMCTFNYFFRENLKQKLFQIITYGSFFVDL